MFPSEIKLSDPQEEMRRYKKTNDINIRNNLVLYYSYIPKAVAAKFRSTVPSQEMLEDIVNEGILTLIECIQKFDESREAKFETYAFLRVRGAAVDYLRREDFLPHRVRKKARDIEAAYNELSTELLREPTDNEIADYLKTDTKSIKKHFGEIKNSVILSFEELLSQSFSSGEDKITGGVDEDSPEESVTAGELSQMLKEAIYILKDNEKTVMSLYYNEELKYKEIAEIMEISESRVCQIHSKAILKLKNELSEYMEN